MAQATSNAKTVDESPNRPVQTIRYGAVRAAMWRNVVANGNASRALFCVTFIVFMHCAEERETLSPV
jgi:hypothetical protein